MARARPSPAARALAGVSLVALTVVAVTVLLHRARFERALLALTEARLALVAADAGARLQAGLDLGLDLPAIANAQAILDAKVLGDPGIAALEVRDPAGKVLFRAGAAGESAGDVAGGVPAGAPATPRPDGTGAGLGAPPPEAETPASVGRNDGGTRSDAGSGLIVVRSGLVNVFGEDAGSLVLTYSRALVGEATGAVTSLLVRVGLTLLVATLAAAWLVTRVAFRDQTRVAGGPSPPEVPT